MISEYIKHFTFTKDKGLKKLFTQNNLKAFKVIFANVPSPPHAT